MATRIIGIPDANGTIRISCGEDIVEIVIAPPADPPTPPITWDPGSMPGTYMRAPIEASGDVDWEGLRMKIERQTADPSKPNPEAVVLGIGEKDLHELSRLGDKVDALSSLPLAVDFGEPKGK